MTNATYQIAGASDTYLTYDSMVVWAEWLYGKGEYAYIAFRFDTVLNCEIILTDGFFTVK